MSSRHLVTVCVVCVLCAAHAPCSAHTDLSADLRERGPAESAPESRIESIDFTAGHDRKYYIFENTGGERRRAKKYAHSYSEEKASRLAAKLEKKEKAELEKRTTRERTSEASDDTSRPVLRYLADAESRQRRNVPDDKYYMKKLFDSYGDGTSLSIEGFEKLLKQLGLFRLVGKLDRFDDTNLQKNRPGAPKDGQLDSKGIGLVDANSIVSTQKCMSSDELLSTIGRNSSETRGNKSSTVTNLPDWIFSRVCPVLVYHLASNARSEREGCILAMNAYSPMQTQTMDESFVVGGGPSEIDQLDEDTRNMVQVWTYSTISIVIISISGLLGMFVVPFMGTKYYHQVLQFFVALAIGTLCGDALIHLLPHAMMTPHSHGHELSHVVKNPMDDEAEHNVNMWKGLTAMIGLLSFFFTEKALAMIAEWRKHRQRKSKLPPRVRVMRETDGTNNVGEKLCKHKYSSYPYCYGEITTETRDNHHHHHHHLERPATIDEEKPLTSTKCNSVTKISGKAENCESPKMASISVKNKSLSGEEWRLDVGGEKDQLKNIDAPSNVSTTIGIVAPELNDHLKLNESESYTVIIREHENKHHGHTHSHGHVHAAPESMSSVAWMVVMGDGLHNFTDGMAIGAAFAANIAGGFSTAIAVFCHELPHELGDFAVLLKAGMSWQQALFYNLLSSVLCLFGMIIGVFLGATPAATSWIFAAAAGMFIYIALVDMIPELSSIHSEEGGSRWECVLQALGLITGLGIMLIIALYEHDLKTIFSD